MGNTIHFGEKYKEALMRGFDKKSETDGLFSHDLDMEFSGVKTVHVTSLKTEPLQDYDRNAVVGKASRYGDTKEVGDEVQTFTMTQDKSLSLSIDKGNNVEQFNMKKAGAVMRAHRDERIVPTMDTYRLNKWAQDAGIHQELSAAPSKSNIVTQIIDLHNKMLDEGVSGPITLVLSRKYLTAVKLSDEWTALDSLGGKSLPKGTIGELDGMPLLPVTSKKMPANVPFMLLHKGSIISPSKINDFKGHVDPPGLSGDLLEFRMMYDAFVLAKKCKGCAAACLPGTVTATPKIAVDGNKATITCEGATIYYTTDGSDPRHSVEAKTYTAAIALEEGAELRAYAVADGKFNSEVAEYDYTA